MFLNPQTLSHAYICVTNLIFRDTDVYDTLLKEAGQVSQYTHLSSWNSAIDRLKVPLQHPHAPPSEIFAAEVNILQNFDIPRFTIPFDDKELLIEGDTVIRWRMNRSPRMEIAHALGALDTNHIEAQCKLIEASFRCLEATPGLGELTQLDETSAFSRQDCFAEGIRLGEQVLQSAESFSGRIGWMTPARVGGSKHYALRPLGPGLYEGKVGVAVFLSLVYSETSDDRFRTAAVAATRDILEFSGHSARPEHEWYWSRLGFGMASGLAGVIYSFACLSALLENAEYSTAACALSEYIDPLAVGKGNEGGALHGIAGVILSLIALHDVTEDPRFLEKASIIADIEIETRELLQPSRSYGPSGFSKRVGLAYGPSGLGIALTRLYERTSRSTFLEAALTLHRAELHTWRTASHETYENQSATELSWCNGRVGMLVLESSLSSNQARVDEYLTLDSTIKSSVIGNLDNICCGFMGYVIARMSSRLEPKRYPGITDPLSMCAARLAALKRGARWRSAGDSTGVSAPGLFNGVSGIGYSLLHLSSAADRGSIALFELPSLLPRAS